NVLGRHRSYLVTRGPKQPPRAFGPNPSTQTKCVSKPFHELPSLVGPKRTPIDRPTQRSSLNGFQGNRVTGVQYNPGQVWREELVAERLDRFASPPLSYSGPNHPAPQGV